MIMYDQRAVFLFDSCRNCLRYSIVNSPDVDVKCPCIGECGEPIEEREMRAVSVCVHVGVQPL